MKRHISHISLIPFLLAALRKGSGDIVKEMETLLDSIETEKWKRNNSLDSSEGPILKIWNGQYVSNF